MNRKEAMGFAAALEDPARRFDTTQRETYQTEVILTLAEELRWVRTTLRDYYAAMAEEDLDDEAEWRRELFDWAGI